MTKYDKAGRIVMLLLRDHAITVEEMDILLTINREARESYNSHTHPGLINLDPYDNDEERKTFEEKYGE